MSNTQLPETKLCPIIHSLTIVSRKWTLPIFCVLNQGGTLRYSQLKRQLNGITNMALTQTLKELVQLNLVDRKQFNEIPPHTEYSLTKDGKLLLFSLYSLSKWGLSQIDSDDNCPCAQKCYALLHEYIPIEKEQDVLSYPTNYNHRYESVFSKYGLSLESSNYTTVEKIELFLLEMLHILTDDGDDETRYTMTYYFRKDTPDILSSERPQYKILCALLEYGQNNNEITTVFTPAYFTDELSKIITGMISEWLMSKCNYNIVEYNKPMLHWICNSLIV